MTDKKRILVVDDEPDVTDILARFLEGAGTYEVVTINDPTKALEAAREFHPDLVVLDVVMATLDGGEVLAEICAEEEFSDIPAIFLTGLVSEAEIGPAGYEISGRAVIPKPVRAEAFRAAVAEQLCIDG